jgi:hypothetical protein
MKRSNWSAGRTSQTKLAGVSPTLRKLWTVPGSTVTTSPAVAVTLRRPRRNSSVPSRTSKRSLWKGWTWAAATPPPGCTVASISTSSPAVSAEVRRK